MLDLQAEQDPFRVPSTRDEMQREFGDRVTVVLVPNASHALFPEQPEAAGFALATSIGRLR